MKRLLNMACAGLLAGLFAVSAQAQSHAAIGSERVVTYDTLAQRYVGPGVLYTAIHADRPWTLDVLEVDLENPYLQMKTVAANDRLRGLELTSSMAARNDRDGHQVVGAVNADFFASNGSPISMQVAGGEFVRRERSGRTSLGFDAENNVMLEMPVFSGAVIVGDTTIAVDGVNEERGADQAVVYNAFFGSVTGTNQYGTEVSLRLVEESEWIVNDTMRFVAEATEAGVGAMTIPEGGMVLSGHGVQSHLLDEYVAEGDTLDVVLNALPGLAQLKELVSGGPYLVEDGEVSVGPRGDAPVRHPRTAAGFNADSTKLYLVTVDGRQSTSIGMSLYELADFMVGIGVVEGMNLDGGGSTTMVVRGDIVNSPSDIGGERPVTNALLVVSSAPQEELSGIYAQPAHTKVFRGGSMRFDVSGIDRFYNPVELDSAQIEYRVDEGLGTIDATGLFTAGMEADTGYVYVRYGTLSDSARVIVKTVRRVEIDPSGIVADTLSAFTFTANTFDEDNVERKLDPNVFVWSSTDPEVGVVDAEGTFQGLQPGETQVVVAYGELADTAWVRVEVGEGHAVLAAMDDPAGWHLAGENVDLNQSQLVKHEDAAASGGASLRLDYRYTYASGQQNWISIETNRPVYGIPDSFVVDVQSDDGAHKVFVEVQDANGRSYQILAPGRGQQLPTETLEPVRVTARRSGMVYPLQLRRVGFRLEGDREEGTIYEGALFLDDLRVIYPDTRTDRAEEQAPAVGVALHPNYPNPFRESTRVTYELDAPQHVVLGVYDVLGRRVLTLVDDVRPAGRHYVQLDEPSLAPGIYMCRMQAGERVATRTMVVIP